MKAVFLTREGTPLYENGRLVMTQSEKQRVRQMITNALRCQLGSEIFSDYGLDIESVTHDEEIARLLIKSALRNTTLFPGVSAFTSITTRFESGIMYSNITYITESGTTGQEEITFELHK